MNCLIYCFDSWKRPINWFRNLWQLFYNIKWAYQRVIKGYCDYDLWDMDIWLCRLFYFSIMEFANNIHGYPDSIVNNEYEWKKILYDMSSAFKKCNISEDFILPTSIEKDKEKAFNMLSKYFYYLWD